MLLPLGLGANTALAAFTRLDNFNSGTAGTQHSTYNSKWAANADFKIAVDPLNSANMVNSIARTLTPNNWGTAFHVRQRNRGRRITAVIFETVQNKLLVFRQHGRIIEFDCPAYKRMPRLSGNPYAA